MQRQSVAYSGSISLLEFHLSQLAGDIETIKIDDKKFLKVFKEITVRIDRKMVVLEVIITNKSSNFSSGNIGADQLYCLVAYM